MRSARSGSSAFGAVAGAAIVTSGIVGGLLAGTAPVDASTANEARTMSSAPNVCGQPPAATTAPRTGANGQVMATGDTVFSSTPATKKATASASSTTSATASASSTTSATASASSTTSATASASSTTSPTASASATAGATGSASASASNSSSPSGSSSASPSDTASASPSSSSPTPDPSPSPTQSSPSPSPTPKPSPSPSPTKTKTPVQLCLKVQPLGAQSRVKAGGTASYAIWIWPAGGAAGGVSVTVNAKVAGKTARPTFTVCPTASGLTCVVGGISKGRTDELQVTVQVPKGTAAGKQVSLSATARASDATAPPPASAALSVAAAAKPSASSSAAPTPSPAGIPSVSPSGVGATLPAGILPTVPSVATPSTILQLPSPQSPLGSLFPEVSPAPVPTPSPYSATLPNARDVRMTDVAATFPFSTRLIGGELAGLAVLAAALALAIVRFSLRRPRPQHGKDAGK